MMIKKRYIIVALATVSVLLGSLLYNSIAQAQKGREPSVYKDSAEIVLMDIQTNNVGFGVRTDDNRDAILPFVFTPKGEIQNVSGLWITAVVFSSVHDDVRFNITVNTLTFRSNIAKAHDSYPITMSTYIDASDLSPQTVTSGINVVVISNPELWDTGTGQWVSHWLHLFKVTVFIEYKYQAN